MTWTNLNFVAGQILSSAEMTLLQNNFQALIQANPGAPVITESALVDSSVTRSKFISTTASLSGDGSDVEIELNPYAFMPAVVVTSATPETATGVLRPSFNSGTADQPRFQLNQFGGTIDEWQIKYRYLS